MIEQGPAQDEPVSISLFLDDAGDSIATYKQPARFHLDTTQLADGEHVLRIQAVDAIGNVGVRRIPFVVANGPGITVTGLRAGSRVRGAIEIDVNAFGAQEPFDPVRAESPGPVPVWTWVLFVVIVSWAVWYGIVVLPNARSVCQDADLRAESGTCSGERSSNGDGGSTRGRRSGRAAQLGSKNVAGFDYATLGAQVYTASCQACHGESGTGVQGTFPPLAGDPVVNGANADAHIRIVLHGLSGKVIGGTHYAAQMPAFASPLSDAQIAAVVDHERTSWQNHGPIVTPEEVRRDR